MLSSVEQTFVGRDEIRASLKRPAWEANPSHVFREKPWDEVPLRIFHYFSEWRGNLISQVDHSNCARHRDVTLDM